MRTSPLCTFVLALLVAALLTSCDGDAVEPGDPGFYANDPTVDLKRRDVLAPESPVELKDVLSTFDIVDGFEIELFAAEPLITDPVAMDVDEEGRMYVLELHGYPDDHSGSSTVQRLVDTNEDGRPDSAVVFVDGLRLPKGLMAWSDGLIVTDPPEVVYFEDTDGDGRADLRRTLLSGFGTANPQLGVNNPIYNVDNWVYLAHMDPDTELRVGGAEGRIVPGAARRNIRFRPDHEDVEVLASRSQFGHTFDAWGHHFLMTNSNPFFQEVIGSRYLQRNPSQLVATTTQDLSTYGDPPLVYPITRDSVHALTNEGAITSASGSVVYLGGAFPEAYAGVVFVAEPIYNVVHAARLRKEGASFAAERLLEGREFLASTDRWFRPVNLYIGPDGALYVLDYSRQIIEQPKFLTREILEAADVFNGLDRGRIYRIAPVGADDPNWLDGLDLASAASDELAAMLESENIWYRRTAQRLLVTRRAVDSVSRLRRMSTESRRAETRLHALWALDGLDALEAADIMAALRDESAGVRENAVLLAEKHMGRFDGLDRALLEMAGEQDPHVRYRLLLALGDLASRQAAAVRERLLFDNIENEWMQVAALSASQIDPKALYDRAVSELSGHESPGRRSLFRRIGSWIGAEGRQASIRGLVHGSVQDGFGPENSRASASVAAAWWRAAALEGLAEGLRSETVDELDLDDERERLLAGFFDAPPEVRAAALRVLSILVPERRIRGGSPKTQEVSSTAQEAGDLTANVRQQAASIAKDPAVEPDRRADVIRLLALYDLEPHREMLQRLVNPREPAPVQEAAVAVLGRQETERAAHFLLSKWESMTPAVRTQTINIFLDRDAWLPFLFDAIESRRISPTAIPRHRDEDLVEHHDPSIRSRANRVLRRDAGERRHVVQEYQTALQRPGEPQRGRAVFDRVCSMCHQVGGNLGIAIGPDMATIENRPPRWLLEAILAPNVAVAEGHEFWTVQRTGGKTLYGVIAGETPTSVTIRAIGGAETVVRREDIHSMVSSESSAMPEGLENQISIEQMSDLVAYLMTVQTIN